MDIFDTDGELAIPTMRGSANLDVEDYEGFDGRSSFLDDGLQEDVRSTPGRNPGAAAATDVVGTDSFDMLEGDMDDPGMKQTTYGNSPWGPGSDVGYRPYSQQQTGMSLRALGDEGGHQEQPKADTMREEVIDSVGVEEATPWDTEWHGNQNLAPSNEGVDPSTIYDRTSYEHDTSDQDTIGNGIFSMEEGVAFRPRDGSFSHDFALPAYIAEEDELGVQQSAMWDSTAGEWRVTQPSASGVALSTRVAKYKAPYSPFADAQLRPEVTGPRSHIEAFGRLVSASLMQEARAQRPEARTKFLASAIDMLGPGQAARCHRAADQLVKLGYRPDVALEDAVAHCVMHAAVKDLTQKGKRKASLLPRLDRMATKLRVTKPAVVNGAAQHIAPLTKNSDDLRGDLGALYASPAAKGMGLVDSGTPAPPSTQEEQAAFPTKKLLLASGLGLGALLLWGNRKKIAKNIKKLTR
jgi:hypothetical protein